MTAYDHLTGRSFVRDNKERLCLASRSLQTWATRYRQNARRAPLTLCLTTTPSRISHLAPTLASLFAQEVRPREIRLHLPAWSRREQRAYIVPSWLQRLPVRIVTTEDFGPATKLLPALLDTDPDEALLVVDDDKLYPSGLVASFADACTLLPDVAWGSSGWLAPVDLTDRPTTLLSNLLARPPTPVKSTRVRQPVAVDVLQGYSGYLVRPRFFDLAHVLDYSQAPEAAFFVDDVWISAHCRVEKRILPQARYCFEPWSKRSVHAPTSLGRLNRGAGEPAQRHNSIMLRHFRDAWLCSPRAHEGT